MSNKRYNALIPESLLAQLWQARAHRHRSFRTGQGQRVKVLYPGRRASEAGPDFRDALIYQEGLGLVRCDVELHLRPEDWKGHGHHRDPRYNSVAFHGVLHGGTGATTLPGGGSAPLLHLAPLLADATLEDAPTHWKGLVLWGLLETYGYPRPLTKSQAQQLLDDAGDARFLHKSRTLAFLCRDQPPEEVLYQGLMECLGYSENRSPFLQLARDLPYRLLCRRALKVDQKDAPAHLEALMLRTAGLIDLGEGERKLRWNLFRVRPGNHPRRRIAGMARLLSRRLDQGLLSALTASLDGAPPAAFRRVLMVADPRGGPAFIGKDRAAEMAVNAVLPLLHALDSASGESAPSTPALAIYRGLPRLPANRVSREMESSLFPASWLPLGGGARRQQGLLHLHRLVAAVGGAGVS